MLSKNNQTIQPLNQHCFDKLLGRLIKESVMDESSQFYLGIFLQVHSTWVKYLQILKWQSYDGLWCQSYDKGETQCHFLSDMYLTRCRVRQSTPSMAANDDTAAHRKQVFWNLDPFFHLLKCFAASSEGFKYPLQACSNPPPVFIELIRDGRGCLFALETMYIIFPFSSLQSWGI